MKRNLLLTVFALSIAMAAQTAPTGRVVGTVKSIAGNTVTVNSDAGDQVQISIKDGARLLQLEPGQRDLKAALPLQLQDLQVGDRVLARGTLSADGKSLDAVSLIAMKQASISQQQQKEREEWQRNSVGGLVKDVDPAAGTLTITVGAGPTSKSVLVRTSKSTVVRRYAANSIRFNDAKKSTLSEIKPGDQLRARGTKAADGTEITAQEIVSGSFRNIAGTVQAVDVVEKTLTVMDLATKKPVTVKVTADSQMHQLPEMMAQRIAMRLKGITPQQGRPPGAAPSSAPPQPAAQGTPGRSWAGAGAGGTPEGNGGDLQRMLSRTPAVTLAELKKGDAVMIVSTEGSESTPVTAITLLSGVEPILTASPDSGKAAMALSAWSLDSSAAETAAQ